MNFKKDLKILPECTAEEQKGRKYEGRLGGMVHRMRKCEPVSNKSLQRLWWADSKMVQLSPLLLFAPLCDPFLLSWARPATGF